MNGGLQRSLPGKVTATSLELPERMSFEEWQKAGEAIQRCERAVMWWLGDWWLHGDRVYGEAAAQAAPTGYSSETLRGAAWVCSKIPPELRRSEVPYSFHLEVANLECVYQQTLLGKAAEEDWTQRELRKAVKALKSPHATPLPPVGQYSVIPAARSRRC